MTGHASVVRHERNGGGWQGGLGQRGRRQAYWWLDPRAAALVVVGLLLVVSGLVHLIVWAVVGGPWEGPVTWRKPILFGISGGLTAASLGWAWSRLPWRWGDGWFSATTALALGVEVALIDLQRWRGVASHFNRDTPLDSLLYDAMGLLILWVTLAATDLAIRFFRRPPSLSADMLLAARAGLLFLVVSCVLGIWVSVLGDLRLAAGLEAGRFGAAGVPKFPHGVVIHAIQWLPLLAWGASLAGLAEAARLRLVRTAIGGSCLLLAYAIAQTLAGRGRFDMTPFTTLVLVLATAGLAGPAAVILAEACRVAFRAGSTARADGSGTPRDRPET